MNMNKLKASRIKPVEGDLFAIKITDSFYYGRVIKIGVSAGGFPNSNLLYFYTARSPVITPIPLLSPINLIIPPQMTNNQGWLKGYFQTIENRPLSKNDILSQHCFRSDAKGKYFDEYGKELPKRIEPCGDWGLASYQTIDEDISRALGLPTPEGEESKPQNHSGVRTIRHFLYFPEKTDASRVAMLLRKKKYAVESKRSADEKNWLVLAQHKINPISNELDAAEAWLETLAKEHGGEYDGRETEL